jgi:hypothetical protein
LENSSLCHYSFSSKINWVASAAVAALDAPWGQVSFVLMRLGPQVALLLALSAWVGKQAVTIDNLPEPPLYSATH